MANSSASEHVLAELPLNDLRIDGGTQQRAEINEGVVAEYAEDVDALPPVVVFHDGSAYWLAAGFHRYHAHRKAERDTIRCEIRKGTRRDAILFAVGDNAVHGLRRSPADKRKAVQTLLEDEEWKGWSDRQIARLCRVGPHLPAEVRNELSVRAHRCADAPAPRKARRKGTTYAQKPRKKKDPPPPPADNEEEPGPPPSPDLDAIGLPVPEALRPVFESRKLFAEARSLHRKLTAKLNEIAQIDAVAEGRLRRDLSRRERDGKAFYRHRELESFAGTLNAWEPHAARCPWCLRDHGGEPDPSCVACYGHDWVPLQVWKRAPKEERQAVESLAPQKEKAS